MIEFPSELQRGTCDQLLSGVASPSGSVVVVLAINLIRSGPRALVHVTDAGSNMFENGSPLSIRLVMSDATQLQPGDLIKITRFSLNEIHSTKLVTVVQFDKVGHWSGFSSIGKATPHPCMGSSKMAANGDQRQSQNQQGASSGTPNSGITMEQNGGSLAQPPGQQSYQFGGAPSHINTSNGHVDHTSGAVPGPISSRDSGASGPGAVNMGSAIKSSPYGSGVTRGPVSRNQDVPVYPIKSITSYLHRWRIIGRVVSKSDIRKFSSSKTKEGKVFSFEICDAEGSEIRATCFTKAVDKFYDLLKEGGVYSFSRGDVKEANTRFNTTGHEFEIIFNEDAEIQILPQDDRIPRKTYNFIPISEIKGYSKGQSLDLLGILLKAGPITTITVKSTGVDTQKRELTIIDQSGHSIDLTLWSERTQLDEGLISQNPVVAVKNALVEEFNGFRLKLGSSSSLEWNPAGLEKVQELRNWFHSQPNVQNSVISLSSSSPTSGAGHSSASTQRLSIEEIIASATSGSNSADVLEGGIWVQTYGTIRSIRDNKYYWSSCPKCKRKVTEIEDPNSINALVLPYNSEKTTSLGPNYHCPSCQQSIENPIKKYILSCEIVDSTGALRAVAFAEHGETIMDGLSVEKLESLKENSERNTEDCFSDKLFSEWVFKLNGKKELYQDSEVIKYRIFSAEDMTNPEVLNREARRKLEYIYEKLNSDKNPSNTYSKDQFNSNHTVKVGMGFGQFGY
ncbi:replication protein A 70 kDa DNA-binding subunit A-like [Cryptosporidium felis]|nr:replication protein A 70 kDa DNA-binding subunit A-like [Cryptosporidium felis]